MREFLLIALGALLAAYVYVAARCVRPVGK